MLFTPVDKMMERVEKNNDSDSTLFLELLYAGEFITKATGAALVASIEDDPENHRYGFLHDLVRAEGIGKWANIIDEICTGPASQYFSTMLTDDRRVFTERGRTIVGSTKRYVTCKRS